MNVGKLLQYEDIKESIEIFISIYCVSMISLRISNSCKDIFSSFESDDASCLGILIGHVDNQVYNVMDLLKLKLPIHLPECPNFEQFAKSKYDDQDTVESRISFLVSNVKLMLVGGVSILGLIYKHKFSTFDPKNSALIKDILDSIQGSLDKLPEIAFMSFDAKKNDTAAVLYEYKTRKFSSLNFLYQNLKEKPTLISINLQTELLIPVAVDAPIKHSEIPDKLKESIKQWTTDLTHAHIKINGLFFDKNDTIETIKNKIQGGDNLKLSIFSPNQIKKVRDISGKTFYLTFRGAFTAYSYSFSKKSILKESYLALIKDLTHAVQSKLNLFLSENDAMMDQSVKPSSVFFLPSRIYFESQVNQTSSFVYSDYLTGKEQIKDSKERVNDWILGNLKSIDSFELESGQKIRNGYELEKTAPKIEAPKPRKPDNETKTGVTETDSSEPVVAKENDTMKYVILVAVVLVLASVYFVYLK